MNFTPLGFLFFLLPILTLRPGFASSGSGPEEADSLKCLLETTSGVEKAAALVKLSVLYYTDNTGQDTIFPLLNEALHLYKSSGDLKGIAAVHSVRAAVYRRDGDKRNGISHYLKAADIYHQLGNWQEEYNHISAVQRCYDAMDNLDSALFWLNHIQRTFTGRDQWMYRIAAGVVKADYYNLLGNFSAELGELTMIFDSTLALYRENPHYSGYYFLSFLPKLSSYYSRHGYYKNSLETSKRLLNELTRFHLSHDQYLYFRGKCYGSMAIASGDWGRLDTALMYHEVSENYFDSVIMIMGQGVDYVINKANQIEGKAIVQMQLGQYDQAEANFRLSLSLREKQSDVAGIAMCYDGLAELNQLRGRYATALEYFGRSLALKEKYRKDWRESYSPLQGRKVVIMIDQSLIITWIKMGDLYREWLKTSLAIQSYQNALALSREIGDRKSEAETLIALADTYLADQLTDTIHDLYLQALEINSSIDIPSAGGIAYARLGNFDMRVGNFPEALEHYHEAARILNAYGIQNELSRVYLGMGQIYQATGQPEKALINFYRCLEIAGNLRLQKPLMEAHKGISDAYATLGNISDAFQHYRQYIESRDSIFSIENQRIIAEVQEKFETAQKDQQLEFLKNRSELQEYRIARSRYILVSLGGLGLLLMAAGMLILRQDRLRQEQKQLAVQQKLLRSQMNPHFIFNALTNIQRFIFDGHTEAASDYLTIFSRLLRDILTNSRQDYITLEQEIDTINNYLNLQRLRFSEKFDFGIELDEKLETGSLQILPMLTQPFIENAIEHGLKHKPEKGNLTIRFGQDDHCLLIEVEDDGVGRQRAIEIEAGQEKDHLSMATSVTRERLAILQKRHRRKFELEITDLKNSAGEGTGTRVRFRVPCF